MVAFAPWWGWALAAAALFVLFALAGRPAGKTITTRAEIPAQVQPPTPDVITRALGSLGIAQINQAIAQRRARCGTSRRRSARTAPAGGSRSTCRTASPPRRSSSAASSSRRACAARSARCGPRWSPTSTPGAWNAGSAGRTSARRSPRRGRGCGRAAGTCSARCRSAPTRVGRRVDVAVIEHNWLLGSMPGQGKTSAVRVLVGAAALDPTVEMWLHELKGTGDLDPFECCSHRFISGIDDESIGYAAESLALLRREVMARADRLKKLDRALCPDKKVTRQIANKRSLKLYPLMCAIDECQNLFGHPKYGKQAGEDAVFIIKIGRALGVFLILATQRPDKDSLPTGVSGNVSTRFCLKVAGQVENDMILGTSAYKNGARATTFRPKIDAGLGYLKGEENVPQVVRTYYLNTETTERVARRARAHPRGGGHAVRRRARRGRPGGAPRRARRRPGRVRARPGPALDRTGRPARRAVPRAVGRRQPGRRVGASAARRRAERGRHGRRGAGPRLPPRRPSRPPRGNV